MQLPEGALRIVWTLAHSGPAGLPKGYLKHSVAGCIAELEENQSHMTLIQLGNLFYGISLLISHELDAVYSQSVQTAKALNRSQFRDDGDNSMPSTKRRKSMLRDPYSVEAQDNAMNAVDFFNWPPTELIQMAKWMVQTTSHEQRETSEHPASMGDDDNSSVFSVTDNLLDTLRPLGDVDEVPENLFAMMDDMVSPDDAPDEAEDFEIDFDMPDWEEDNVENAPSATSRPSTPANDPDIQNLAPPLTTPENTPHRRKTRVVKPKTDVRTHLTDTAIERAFENYESWAREQQRKRKRRIDWFKFFNVKRPDKPSDDPTAAAESQEMELNLQGPHESDPFNGPSEDEGGLPGDLDDDLFGDAAAELEDDGRFPENLDEDLFVEEDWSSGPSVDLEENTSGYDAERAGHKSFYPIHGDEVFEAEIMERIAEKGGIARLDEIVPGAARAQASGFHSVLILAASGRLTAQQDQSYGSITLKASFRFY